MPDDSSSKGENKLHRAVALQYESAESLPHVIATGTGEAALKIIEAAERAGVPISQDADLTKLLSKVPVGTAISSNMYTLVANVIAFLYHTDKEWREKHGFLYQILGEGME
ncbi:MAG: EscU/YscU/HrcU family type III secretion system export apparatus switch protein [Bdellovibrionota bacterium]